MGIFFDIIHFAASSVFWGLLLAAAMMGLFVFIVRGWWKDAMFTVWTYVGGGILALLLFFQCTLIVGALKIKSLSNDCEEILTALVEKAGYSDNYIIDRQESNSLFSNILEEYPIIANYIGAISGSEDGINGSGYIWAEGYTAAEWPHAIIEYQNSLMNEYILRRILWSLGFVLVLGFICIKTMETTTNSRLKARSNDRTARRATERISRDTKRISRRR